jgi:hypothetical protein
MASDFTQALAQTDLPKAWALGSSEAELVGLLELSLTQAELALSLANQELETPGSKFRFYAACLLKADSLLKLQQPKAAVLALAPALGIQEQMNQSFSALSLALLAEAQAAWGKKSKAIQTGNKALERTGDAYAKSRANYALWLATGQRDCLEKARDQAKEFPAWLAYLPR